MTIMPAMALAVTISLALHSASEAETASSTSTAPVGEPALAETTDPTAYAGRPFADLIEQQAQAAGVPVELAHAIVAVESNYRIEVTGRAGEVGLMQIKPATARDMGFKGPTRELYNPAVNLKYGLKYLAGAQERGGGSLCGTILKYNAGHYSKRMNPTSARYCDKVKVQLAQS